MLTDVFDFPVALKELRTIDGTKVPGSRAVVRTDTDEPISVVSNRYKIIGHGEVMGAVTPYMREIGEPERKLYIERRGARFTAEYLFRDKTIDVGTNHVALRVVVQNAYMTGYAVRIQVAVTVLECLNLGIISEKSIFDVAVRHTGEHSKIELPPPETLLKAFTSSQTVFNRYSTVEIKYDAGSDFLLAEKAPTLTALPETTREAIAARWTKGYDAGQRTVWDLLQHATYEITHNSPRLSFTGRHQRLTRTARIFNAVFAGY